MRKLLALPLIALPLSPLSAQETAQEERDVGFLTGLIEENLSGVSRTIRIEGFDGALSSRATLESLTIADEQGVWLEMTDIVLDWNRSALLRGALEVEELTAAEIVLSRLPTPEPAPVTDVLPSPETSPFSLPDLPVSVDIGTLSADRIVIGEAVAGVEAALTLQASAFLDDGDLRATLTAERIDDGPDGRFALSVDYSEQQGQLAIDVDFVEGPGGLVASSLALPDEPSVELSISGEGPVENFEAELTLLTDGDVRVSGTAGVDTGDDGDQLYTVDLGGDVTALLAPQYRPFFGDDLQLIARGERLADGALVLETLDVDAEAVKLQGSARIGPTGWPERFDLTGRLGSDNAEPVLLPVGTETRVDAMDLEVSFDAAAGDEWQARFVIEGFERPEIDIEDLTLEGRGIIIDGSGEAEGRVTAEMNYGARGILMADRGLQEALGDRLEGRFVIDATEDQPIRVAPFTFEGAGLEAQITAAIRASEPGLETELDLSAKMESFARLSRLTGLDLRGGGQLDVAGVIVPLEGGFDLTVDMETSDLGFGIEALDPLLGGDGTLHIEAARNEGGISVDNVTLRTGLLSADATARVTSGTSTVDFDARITEVREVVPGLEGPARLVGTARIPEEGAATARIDLDAPGGLNADIVLNATRNDVMRPITAEIDASIERIGPYAALAGLDLEGEATVEGTAIVPVQGPMDFDLAVTGPGGLSGDVNARVSQSGDFRPAQADVDLAIENLSVYAALGGVDLEGAATLDGQLALDQDGIATADVTVTGPGALSGTIDGRADTTAPGFYPASADLDLTVGDLTPYTDLAGVDLRGPASVDGTVAVDKDGAADADLAVTGPGGLRGTIDASANLTTEDFRPARADLDLRMDDLSTYTGLAGLSLGGPASVEGVVALPDNGTGTADVRLTGPGALDATLDATMDFEDAALPFEATLAGRIGSLSAYSGVAGQSLSGAVRLDVSAQGQAAEGVFDADVSAQTTSIGIGQRQVDLLLRGTGDIAADVSRDAAGVVNLRNLSADLPNLNLTGSATVGGGQTGANFDARLRDIGLFTPDISGPVTATGTVNQRAGGALDIDVDATGPGGIAASVDGTYGPGATANLRSTGTFPLGLANAYLGDDARVQGRADFDLAVDGALDLSNVSGTITTENTRIAAPALPNTIDDLEATIRLGGGTANVDMRAAVSGGGNIVLRGPVALSGGYDANLTARINNLQVEDPALYTTTADGELTVEGSLTGGARIAGRIDIGETEIRIPSSGIGALGEIPDITHIRDSRAAEITRDRAGIDENSGDTDTAQDSNGATGGGRYPVDILIRAPQRIFVRGRGLDAELGGQLRLRGTLRDLIPQGRFNLIRGRLDILGQRFEFDEGSATLQGDFVPYIRLVAVTDRDDVTVRVVVEGPADAPEISFNSVPDLPEDEVLAQLLFGRSIEDISPLQAVQLASAAATLAGRGGGGLVDNLRENFGLDDLDITTTEDGNVAVRAGAYISENVYTDLTVGADGTSEINLNLDVTRSITVTGSAGSDGETSLGVFFQRDY